TSITFTTQSESVPLVEATRFTTGCPLIFNGSVSTSETKVTTSGRPDASRWSSTSHSDQVLPSPYPTGWIGRLRNGTGFAGSETYSSNALSPPLGASKPSFRPAFRYIFFASTGQPLAQPAGHDGRCNHVLLPVSNAETVVKSAFGASSFR